jgi:uncharacterized protein with ATP-grasp and redox domains
MKTYLDCIPCFFRQGLTAARMAGLNSRGQKEILDEIARIIPDIPLESSPPEIGRNVYKAIKEISGIEDPYKKVKKEYIELALRLYPELKKIVEKSKDPLLTAIRIAIAGNIIDFGVGEEFNVEETLNSTLKEDFAILDYQDFKDDLKEAEMILYIGDNAGETVFDRVLIEEINGNVYYAVRGEPIINDVTFKDAIDSGIAEVAGIIPSGSDAPGTILKRCNQKFLGLFYKSDIIISKGQGNYETLSEVDKDVYFLLMVKCPVIARDIGVKEQSIILLKHSMEREKSKRLIKHYN